jgi:uncharacterized protein YdhG (YjbR/CyaY superfamily)
VKTVDEYIKRFPPEIQKGLNELRAFIKAEAPEAEEKIAYRMPAYQLNGTFIYFAAFKDHYSLYPIPAGTKSFEKELFPYKSGKSTLRFPLDKPLPWGLIRKVIQLKKQENLKKARREKQTGNAED